MTLEEARELIGHLVLYRFSQHEIERGVIVDVGEVYVFVRYGHDLTSKATRPEDLMEDPGEPELDKLTDEDWANLRDAMGEEP